MTFFRGEEGFWAAASSQRTLYLVRDKSRRGWLSSKRTAKVGRLFKPPRLWWFFFRLSQSSDLSKIVCFPSKAAAKVVNPFHPPSDGETFFGCRSDRLSKRDLPSVESGRKDSGSFSPTKRIVSFFRPFFRSENSSH